MTITSASGPASGHEPALDHTVLAKYAERRTGLLERLVAAYLEETPGFHQDIKKGVEVADFDLIKLNAHVLKSCSSNLGAVRLSKLCQDLESSALSRDGVAINRLVERLGPECFEVEEALKGVIFKFTGKALTEALGSISQPK